MSRYKPEGAVLYDGRPGSGSIVGAPKPTGAFRIVPNAASEQAETIEAVSVEAALADFKRRHPDVEVWDVIELRRAH